MYLLRETIFPINTKRKQKFVATKKQKKKSRRLWKAALEEKDALSFEEKVRPSVFGAVHNSRVVWPDRHHENKRPI